MLLALNAIQPRWTFARSLLANCLPPDAQNDNGWDQGLLVPQPIKCLVAAAGFCDADEFRGNISPRGKPKARIVCLM